MASLLTLIIAGFLSLTALFTALYFVALHKLGVTEKTLPRALSIAALNAGILVVTGVSFSSFSGDEVVKIMSPPGIIASVIIIAPYLRNVLVIEPWKAFVIPAVITLIGVTATVLVQQ